MDGSTSRYETIRRVAGVFERHVPEYREGTVEIVAVASEPGTRTKVALASNDRDIDPIGACVGPKGVRARAIVEDLGGERVDFVPFEENPVRFVCHAVAPAQIKRVFINEESRSMELIVEDEQLERALGEEGVNLRLAAVLTDWRLDLVSESRFDAMREELRADLAGIDSGLVDHLFQCGYTRVDHLAGEKAEALAEFAEISPEEAAAIIRAAQER